MTSVASKHAGSISEQISRATQLPTQPSALPLLLGAITDPDIDAHNIAGTIERFPGIAARLVSLVNSAWSAPVEPITSIERACSHLGLRLVRTVSISLAVMAPFDTTRCLGFDSETYWCNTFLVADSAAQLTAFAGTDDDLSPETVRAAGLFHNLGLLWLADNMPQPTAQAIAVAQSDGVDLNVSLRDRCGTDACIVGGLLGRAWGLPDGLAAAMEHHSNPEFDGIGWQIAALVGIATGIVGAATRGDQELVDDGNPYRLSIDLMDRNKILAHVAAKLDETLEITRSLRL